MGKKEVIIVGAGPVGCLHSCYLAKNGFQVNLYDARDDIRKLTGAWGRSINLAVSKRALASADHIGLKEKIEAVGVPLHSRMIHLRDGTCYPVQYGKDGQHLLSVGRKELNQILLQAASECPNVKLNFKTKMTSCNLETPSATFQSEEKGQFTADADYLFGCDGAYSGVRKQMMRGIYDYQQEYIPHGYKELFFPANKEGKYCLEPNYLHIWPRHDFMLMAMANLDPSFTVTLFMPFATFEKLKNGNDVYNFFEEVFPDTIDLIGEKELRESFFELPALPLINVKCSPYHYKNKVGLLGDAAHATVPFFGQGVNAGLEDVLVFEEIMMKNNCIIDDVLPIYSKTRPKDGHALVDLSVQNYVEMRSSVTSPWFLFRKKVDNLLHFLVPSLLVPRYTMVSFTRTRYHEVIEKTEKQNKVINMGIGVSAFVFLLGSIYGGKKLVEKDALQTVIIPNINRGMQTIMTHLSVL